MKNKVINTTKYYAEPIFNTWAKTGYKYDFENGDSWFICKYIIFLKPAVMAVKFDSVNMFNEEKIIFGGYQNFKKVEKNYDEIIPDFSSICLSLKQSEIIPKDLEKYYYNFNGEEIVSENINNNDITNVIINKHINEVFFNYFGIDNFRNINNYSRFKIKPLTFVTGRNNSGKSSLLKSILLLKELIYDPSEDEFIIRDSEILNIDVDEIKNKANEKNEVIIALNIDFKFNNFPNNDLIGKFVFIIGNKKLILKEFIVEFKDDIEIDFILNLKCLNQNDKNVEIIQLKTLNINKGVFNTSCKNEIISYSFNEIGMGFNTLFNYKNEHISLISLLSLNNKIIISQQDDNELDLFFNSIANKFHDLKNTINYIPSIRTENKRTFKEETSLLGLTLNLLHNKISSKSILNEINIWFEKFGLSSNYSIKRLQDGSFQIKFGNVNLADMGYGFMQIFIVIVQSYFANLNDKKVVFIEEPESNLHPNLQSLLADFFFELNKNYGTQFIIETHSEYLIRNTQLIGLKNNLFNDELSNPFGIIYFESGGKYFEIGYNDDGTMDREFGEGFYDATSEILLQLFLNRKR